MSFQLKELIKVIIEDDMDNIDKVNLLDRIYQSGSISNDLYLKRKGEEGFNCYCREIDINGKSIQVPTNYSPEEIVNHYKEGLDNKRKRF